MLKSLVGVTMGSALTLTSVAFAIGSPSADGVGPSGAASVSTSTVSGSCSKSEATAVVKQLGASDPTVTAPVYKVLCGAFAGAGTQTMVVSLFGPGNTGMIDWVVLRRKGGAWQLLLKQHQAARLTPSGSDIRETVSIFRVGNSRCCPSGGTKARTWRWNGSRFTASSWKQATPGDRLESGHFKTPSANIVCGYYISIGSRASESSVGCVIKSGLRPAPPRRPCRDGGYAGDRVYLSPTGRVSVPPCAGDPGALVGEGSARVLGYGKTWSGSGLRCTSALSGLTCRNKSGHGFFLSRDHWRAF